MVSEKTRESLVESDFSRRTVCEWFQKLRGRYTNSGDADYSERCVDATHSEFFHEMHDLLMDNKGLNVPEIVSVVDI